MKSFVKPERKTNSPKDASMLAGPVKSARTQTLHSGIADRDRLLLFGGIIFKSNATLAYRLIVCEGDNRCQTETSSVQDSNLRNFYCSIQLNYLPNAERDSNPQPIEW